MKNVRFTHLKTLSSIRMHILCSGMITAALSGAALPVAKVSHPAPVDFPSEVYPLLKANCTAKSANAPHAGHLPQAL